MVIRGSLPAAGALAAAVVLLPGCTGTPAPAASPTATATTAAPSGTPSTTPSLTPSGTASPRSPGSSSAATPATTEPAPPGVVPPRARRTLPPAAPSAAVTVGRGARTVLLATRRLRVTAHGPGETAGPALALTLQVTETAGVRLRLGDAAVSAEVGGEEASPSQAPPARPFPASLAPRASARAVYVFVLPAAARAGAAVSVTVSLDPDLPVATFRVNAL